MEIDQLKAIVKARTSGKWTHYDDSNSTTRQEIVAVGVTVARCYAGNPKAIEDADAITAMINLDQEFLELYEAAENVDISGGGVMNLRDALAAIKKKIGEL